jgi:hypothetical protein
MVSALKCKCSTCRWTKTVFKKNKKRRKFNVELFVNIQKNGKSKMERKKVNWLKLVVNDQAAPLVKIGKRALKKKKEKGQ